MIDGLTTQQMHKLTKTVANIRHVCIVSEKTNLQEQLMYQLSINYKIKQKYQMRYCERLDSYDRSQSPYAERKCMVNSLCFPTNSPTHLINVIASRTNISRFTLAADLKLCDGALIIVPVTTINWDWLTMVMVAVANQFVTPLFLINLDTVIKQSYAENLKRICEVVNKIFEIVKNTATRRPQWEKTRKLFLIDNFIFTDDNFNWSFSARKFTQFYKIKTEKVKQQLSKTEIKQSESKQQVNKQTTSKQQKEPQSGQINDKEQQLLYDSTQKWILDQIVQFWLTVYNECEQKLKKNNPQFTSEQLRNKASREINTLTQNSFPQMQALMNSIINEIYSPQINQQYKYGTVYNEAQSQDQMCIAIKQCKSSNPLMVYICKTATITTYSSNWQNYWVGRVYSGALKHSDKVRIINNHADGEGLDAKEVYCKCYLAAGMKVWGLPQLIAGNIVVMSFTHFYPPHCEYILTQLENQEKWAFRRLLIPRIPHTLKVTVTPKQPRYYAQLIQNLRKLAKSNNPQLQFQAQESGENTLKFSNPKAMHQYVMQLYQAGLGVDVSEIYQQYRESVTCQSSELVHVKSQNKHNRLFGNAEPIDDKCKSTLSMLGARFKQCRDFKQNYVQFRKTVGWEQNSNGVVWSFGDDRHENMLVDNLSHSAQSKRQINQIKDSMEAAFNWSVRQGPICEQKVMGVRYNLLDCQLISDAIHRGGGQIIPTSRRLFYAAMLLANPVILQPLISCIVLVQPNQLNSWLDHCQKFGSGKDNTKYRIPEQTQPSQSQTHTMQTSQAAQSKHKQSKNNNYKITVQLTIPAICWNESIFDMDVEAQSIAFNWKQVQGDIFEDGSRVNEIVKSIRTRKGLNQNLPDVTNYIDRV